MPLMAMAGDGSDTGGNGRGKKGYQQRIVQRFQYNAVLEQPIIPFQSKTAPFGPFVLLVLEGKRTISATIGAYRKTKNKGDIFSAQSFFHNVWPSPSLSNMEVATILMMMKIISTMERLPPRCQLPARVNSPAQ